MEELIKLVVDGGAPVALIVLTVIMLRWFAQQRSEDRAVLTEIKDSLNKNSDAIIVLAQGILSIAGSLSDRPCLLDDMKGKVRDLIEDWRKERGL